MPKITIEIMEDTQEFKIGHEGELYFEQMVITFGNSILYYANAFLESVPAEKQPEVKGQMYDMLNEKFSALLELFAPEMELRPDLTAEALLKAENEVIEDKLSKMQK